MQVTCNGIDGTEELISNRCVHIVFAFVVSPFVRIAWVKADLMYGCVHRDTWHFSILALVSSSLLSLSRSFTMSRSRSRSPVAEAWPDWNEKKEAMMVEFVQYLPDEDQDFVGQTVELLFKKGLSTISKVTK